jgi:hypothetical protein
VERANNGSKNGSKKKEGTSTRKKVLSRVMYFQCHKMRHYASQCPFKQCPFKKKGKTKKQIGIGVVARVKEDSSQFETAFSMVFCLSSNTISSIGWYVDNGASRHTTYDRPLFSRLQKRELEV